MLRRIDAELPQLQNAVEHAATRRAMVALLVAVSTVATLLVATVSLIALGSYQRCQDGNEARRAIDVSDQRRTQAFVDALVAVISAGQPDDARARTEAQGRALLTAINNDPELQQATAALQPRDCGYWPF